MADYPVLPMGTQSQMDPRAGIVTDVAEDGTTRSRRLFAATNHDITLVHEYLTAAQRTTLLAHFIAHAALTFNWVSPWGDTYTVRYLNEPQGQPHAGSYWTMISKLTGVKI